LPAAPRAVDPKPLAVPVAAAPARPGAPERQRREGQREAARQRREEQGQTSAATAKAPAGRGPQLRGGGAHHADGVGQHVHASDDDEGDEARLVGGENPPVAVAEGDKRDPGGQHRHGAQDYQGRERAQRETGRPAAAVPGAPRVVPGEAVSGAPELQGGRADQEHADEDVLYDEGPQEEDRDALRREEEHQDEAGQPR
jgi:hypothetical protein